jgi:hypothetical protein
MGEGVVQGQDRYAAGGIAKRRVPQPPSGAAHRASSAVEGRWLGASKRMTVWPTKLYVRTYQQKRDCVWMIRRTR